MFEGIKAKINYLENSNVDFRDWDDSFINWKSIAINSNDLDVKERQILGFSPPYTNNHNRLIMNNDIMSVKANLTENEYSLADL